MEQGEDEVLKGKRRLSNTWVGHWSKKVVFLPRVCEFRNTSHWLCVDTLHPHVKRRSGALVPCLCQCGCLGRAINRTGRKLLSRWSRNFQMKHLCGFKKLITQSDMVDPVLGLAETQFSPQVTYPAEFSTFAFMTVWWFLFRREKEEEWILRVRGCRLITVFPLENELSLPLGKCGDGGRIDFLITQPIFISSKSTQHWKIISSLINVLENGKLYIRVIISKLYCLNS